jgi:hypothetical protein
MPLIRVQSLSAVLNQSAPIVGQGTLPADASGYPVGALWVDEYGTIWQSNGATWDLAIIPDVGEYTILTDETGTVLVDENYTILVE